MPINQPNKKVIFMGTPEIANNCLKALIETNGISVIAVISQPDKPTGRKQEYTYSPVKQTALKSNILLLQPNKLSEIYDQIVDLQPELIFTCAFGQFIPDNILAIPKYGCVNLHASLLPQLRGGAPIHYAIINNFSKTGLTLMYTIKKMDAGNIIKSFEVIISENETYKSLLAKLTILAYDVVKNNIINLFQTNVKSIHQNENAVTFAYNIKREHELINWNQNAKTIDCFIRGLYDKPIASTIYCDNWIKILSAKIVVSDKYSNVLPGTIVEITKNEILVTTKDNLIGLLQIQMPSKKPLLIKEILNGNHIFKVGTKFN